MKFQFNEKIKYYEKRAADTRLTQSQRDYAKGFVSEAKSTYYNFKDIEPKHLHNVERYQKETIKSISKTAHQSGAKQGRIAAYNSVLHGKLPKG